MSWRGDTVPHPALPRRPILGRPASPGLPEVDNHQLLYTHRRDR